MSLTGRADRSVRRQITPSRWLTALLGRAGFPGDRVNCLGRRAASLDRRVTSHDRRVTSHGRRITSPGRRLDSLRRHADSFGRPRASPDWCAIFLGRRSERFRRRNPSSR